MFVNASVLVSDWTIYVWVCFPSDQLPGTSVHAVLGSLAVVLPAGVPCASEPLDRDIIMI